MMQILAVLSMKNSEWTGAERPKWQITDVLLNESLDDKMLKNNRVTWRLLVAFGLKQELVDLKNY